MVVYTNSTRVTHAAYRMAAHFYEQPSETACVRNSRIVDVDLRIIAKVLTLLLNSLEV